jgi:hypothetical protein
MFNQRQNAPSLYDVLSTGYTNDAEHQRSTLGKFQYQRDDELSNNDHQVYFNKEKNHLLYNGNGSQPNVRDWTNNLKIGLGYGHQTDRFKEEKNNLEKAKKKYNPANTTISGHSQFGWHAQELGAPNDKILTYNKAGFGNKKPNEKAYRTTLDPVSSLSTGTRGIGWGISGQTPSIVKLPYVSTIKTVIGAHDLSHIKNRKIYV